MASDDENVARCFGLEIARILLDSSYGEFRIARYESEKRNGERLGGDNKVIGKAYI